MQTRLEDDSVNFSTGLYSGYKLVGVFLNSESAASFMYPAAILKQNQEISIA